MNQQNTKRALPAITAEAYFKHKEVIEAWLQGADVERLNQVNSKWCNSIIPKFEYGGEYRIKFANIKKYIIVGFDGDNSHHTYGVWRHKVEPYYTDEKSEMLGYNKQRTLIELEISPSSGKVVAAKVVE